MSGIQIVLSEMIDFLSPFQNPMTPLTEDISEADVPKHAETFVKFRDDAMFGVGPPGLLWARTVLPKGKDVSEPE